MGKFDGGLLVTDFDETLCRYHIIEEARVYRDSIAISCWDHEVNRALAGQAADDLLCEAVGILYRRQDYQLTVQILIQCLALGADLSLDAGFRTCILRFHRGKQIITLPFFTNFAVVLNHSRQKR